VYWPSRSANPACRCSSATFFASRLILLVALLVSFFMPVPSFLHLLSAFTGEHTASPVRNRPSHPISATPAESERGCCLADGARGAAGHYGDQGLGGLARCISDQEELENISEEMRTRRGLGGRKPNVTLQLFGFDRMRVDY
jgi:hypothetical protein